MKPAIYLDYNFFNTLENVKSRFPNILGKRSKENKGFDLVCDFLFDDDDDRTITIFNLPDDELIDDSLRVLEQSHIDGKIVLLKRTKAEIIKYINNNEVENPLSLFLFAQIEKDIVIKLTEMGFLCISEININEILSSILSDQQVFNIAKNGNVKSWEDLSQFSHTFNSILIFDSFIFKKDQGTNRFLYSESICEIISNLSKNNICTSIHSVIVSPKESITQPLDSIINNISDRVKSKLGNKEILIGVAKTFQKKPINHDRLFFTNYFAFFSGDSANYFNKKKTSDTILGVYSIFDWNNFKTLLNQLEKLKKELPELDRIGSDICKAGNCDSQLLNSFE